MKPMSLKDIEAILARPTTTIPKAGAVLGIARNASYDAARRGEIPTLKFGSRYRVSTARLRQMLGLGDRPAGPAE
jgi:hypothetical protein